VGSQAERLATAVQRPLVVRPVEHDTDEFDEERRLSGVHQHQTRLDVERRCRRLHRQRVLVTQLCVTSARSIHTNGERHFYDVQHTVPVAVPMLVT